MLLKNSLAVGLSSFALLAACGGGGKIKLSASAEAKIHSFGSVSCSNPISIDDNAGGDNFIKPTGGKYALSKITVYEVSNRDGDSVLVSGSNTNNYITQVDCNGINPPNEGESKSMSAEGHAPILMDIDAGMSSSEQHKVGFESTNGSIQTISESLTSTASPTSFDQQVPKGEIRQDNGTYLTVNAVTTSPSSFDFKLRLRFSDKNGNEIIEYVSMSYSKQ